MIAGSLSITGDKQLMRTLDAVSGAIQGKAIASGLYAAGKVVEGHAKTYSRIDLGFMRNSIYVKAPGISDYPIAHAAAKAAAPDRVFLPEATLPDKMTAVVACGAEYGIHNEYPTASTPAQPFMRPGLYNHQDEVNKAFAVNVWQEIKDAIR